jgi:3D (Asp-Asp-Asp) domain-containing protein
VRPGVAAVDPKVVDLGSRLWVEGIGEVVAADTGGGIKGNRIDIYMDKHKTALDFGRKIVMVKILN